VYTGYEECPLGNRGLSAGPSELARQALRRRRASGVLPRCEESSIVEQSDDDVAPAWGAVDGVIYGVCGHDGDLAPDAYTEVELFYETEKAAREHVARCYHMAAVLPFMVYGSYAACPAHRRFDRPSGPQPASQCMKLRGRAVIDAGDVSR
jgi:hypothetical protein